ncbi:Kinesin-like protein KLP1 [Hondaea fermentalgiana]|uniref:Kinesin-like protein n=1 Tax=Hondaea fermentalgiana TaxID=2315210 RepID=A0A2R5GGX0_9STRA|nr:Kinesin-like protein KLP1 [Hondaea fermentalgiana]|eukprot:GBG29845.1 Kinesin-like protein KLP1 [Hondaea fermentalgiana]
MASAAALPRTPASSAGANADRKTQRVRVLVRPRPVDASEVSALTPECPPDARAALTLEPAQKNVNVRVKRDPRHAHGKVDAGEERWAFKFDGVFAPDATQEDVFEGSVPPLLDGVLHGYNGTIFAYGQTGAGKTFTMMGKPGNADPHTRGLAARSITALFRAVESAADAVYTIRMSYLEIYKEQCYDLLSTDAESDGQTASSKRRAKAGNNHGGSDDDEDEPDEIDRAAMERDISSRNRPRSTSKQMLRSSFQFATHAQEGTTLLGLSRRTVRSEEEALTCLFEGDMNRAIASHELNYSSTRSHCIVTLWVERRFSEAESETGIMRERVTSAKLHLVDLAGSERVLKTNSLGSVLQEAKAINKSLSFLEQVVVALGDKRREHIPYRQSLLTHFLQDSLGGNCKSLLIACVWPAVSHAEQTLATLKFATRMMRVKNVPVRNNMGSDLEGPNGAGAKVVQAYKDEIRMLREELALRDAFYEVSNYQHAPFSKEAISTFRNDVAQFMKHGDAHKLGIQGRRVRVPDHDRASMMDKRVRMEMDAAEREKLFATFKMDGKVGAPLFSALEDAKRGLVEMKARSRTIKEHVKAAKASLDESLQRVHAEEGAPSHELIETLRAQKAEYRLQTDALKEVKSEIAFATQAVKSCRQRAACAFEEWLIPSA